MRLPDRPGKSAQLHGAKELQLLLNSVANAIYKWSQVLIN